MNGYGWKPSLSFAETEAVMEELAPKILQTGSEECES